MRLKEAIWQLKSEKKQGEKANGDKSKIALSGSMNGRKEDKGYHSPDFKMTE